MFRPTDEQKEIAEISKKLKSDETLKINAFAGTGKTSTLVYITTVISLKKFLLLAFNKAIVEDGRKKLPPNVDIKTTHSLAFEYYGKGREIVDDYKPYEVAKMFDIETNEATATISAFNAFVNSSDSYFGSSHHVDKKSIEIASSLYEKMRQGEIAITHSFYLKEFQLNTPHMEYDYVLLDEGQDTNEVTLDIFKKIHGAKIIVGDIHQWIYGFRGSLNVMKQKADFEMKLTHTFRCSPDIVKKANWILRTYKRETSQIISKNNAKDYEIKSSVHIARTNAYLISLIEQYDRFYFTRPIAQIFDLPIALHRFLSGEKEKIAGRYGFVNDFADEDGIKKYIEDSGDLEFSSAYKMARRYKGYLFVLLSKSKKNNSKDGICLTTAHSSKGLEFDSVILAEDFPELSGIGGKKKRKKEPNIEEEANLYYVAVTRAKYLLDDRTKNDVGYWQSYTI